MVSIFADLAPSEGKLFYHYPTQSAGFSLRLINQISHSLMGSVFNDSSFEMRSIDFQTHLAKLSEIKVCSKLAVNNDTES